MASRREERAAFVLAPALRRRQPCDLLEKRGGIAGLIPCGRNHGLCQQGGHEFGPARESCLCKLARLRDRAVAGEQKLQETSGADPVVRFERRKGQ